MRGKNSAAFGDEGSTGPHTCAKEHSKGACNWQVVPVNGCNKIKHVQHPPPPPHGSQHLRTHTSKGYTWDPSN